MLVTICEIVLEKLLADANLFFEQAEALAMAADALGCLIDGVTALQNCFFLLENLTFPAAALDGKTFLGLTDQCRMNRDYMRIIFWLIPTRQLRFQACYLHPEGCQTNLKLSHIGIR